MPEFRHPLRVPQTTHTLYSFNQHSIACFEIQAFLWTNIRSIFLSLSWNILIYYSQLHGTWVIIRHSDSSTLNLLAHHFQFSILHTYHHYYKHRNNSHLVVLTQTILNFISIKHYIATLYSHAQSRNQFTCFFLTPTDLSTFANHTKSDKCTHSSQFSQPVNNQPFVTSFLR